uniref:Molybdopterin synthase catalytic subunit n=1 Tax=Xenopus tropicalis TaxID=8364 RepID=A0A6I8QPR4_XENTR
MNEDAEEPQEFIKITHSRLSADEVSQLVTSPSCGAVSIFIGSTRNTFDGKKVVRLEYECYIPMAEMEIKKIFLDVRRQWPHVKHLAVHHRLGLVPVSEASVVIAVSSPHRSDSLDAVKYCINRLKATVPIWKKVNSQTRHIVLNQQLLQIYLVDSGYKSIYSLSVTTYLALLPPTTTLYQAKKAHLRLQV